MSKHIYNIIPDRQDTRDYKFSDTFKGVSAQASTDLRSKFPFTFDQGQLGSCSSNSAIMDLMYTLGFDKVPLLSRLYHYWEERNIEGTVGEDSGAMIVDSCKVLQKFGSCEETLFPYDIANFTNTPTDEMNQNASKYAIKSYHRLANLDEVKQALAMGLPVLLGMSVYESMETDEVAQTGRLPMPTRGEKCLGGHAVLGAGNQDKAKVVKQNLFTRIINYLTGNVTSAGDLIVKNSWGEKWGDKGYFYMSYEYFNKYVNDAWVLINN